MATLENARGVHGIISAPPRETNTPVITKPDIEPVLVVPEPEKPEPPKKTWYERLDKVLESRLVRLGLATGVVGLGGIVVRGDEASYQNIPTVHQQVANTPGRFGLIDTAIPPAFDNTKEKQIIGAIKKITPEEANQKGLLTPEVNMDKDTNTITVITFFPLILPSQSPNAIIPFDKTLELTRGQNPKTLPISAENFPSLPKDSVFIAPKGSNYAVVKYQDGKIKLAATFFYDEIHDVTIIRNYGTDVGFASKVPTLDMAKNYMPADPSFNFENLPVSDGITPIVGTIQDNQRVDISISVVRGKYKPGNRDFFLAPESSFKTDKQSQILIGLAPQN